METLWTNVTDIATGIVLLFSQAHGGDGFRNPEIPFHFNLAYTSISASLNVLLTLMIVIRLVLRGRSVHAATGSRAGLSGLYKTFATMFVESSALYAGISLVVIGLWATFNYAWFAFVPALYIIQVCASRALDPQADCLK